MSVLPGIDPNDYDKTDAAACLIETFANLIPLRDASRSLELWNDLSEHEVLICGQSSQFNDFVVQYLDR